MSKIGILGGGISGLACAHFLQQDSVVLEQEDRVGGLCRTFRKDGFAYDQGGHIIFSKDKPVLDLELGLLGENKLQQFRRNVIWYKNRFVKYPFENGLAALDKDDLFDCLYHYLKNDHKPPSNFQEWVYYTFGTGIAERYLLPYNRKIWKIDPAQMSMGWVERVPKPPLEDVLKSAIGIETEGYLHQLYFHYPREGGFESLVRAFAASAPRIETGFQVERLRRDSAGWDISDGRQTIRCQELISTIPLASLSAALCDVPSDIQSDIDGLRYNTVIVAMIGVNKPYLSGKSAIYIPDPACLAHRLCFNTYFSPSMAPEGCSSLIAEITSGPDDDIASKDDAQIVQELLAWLEPQGFLHAADVVATDMKRVRYGYPVYDLDYDRKVARVRSYFESRGIHLCGRFAEHLYINSDACVRRAWDLAQRLRAPA